MSKKRPSQKRRLGKYDVAYWRGRLFRNTYTLAGRRFELNHWSVKIQHLGERKTFSLAARQVARAAAEACGLYRAIVREGWVSAAVSRRNAGQTARNRKSSAPDQSQAGYWRERLIHRPYTMGAPAAVDELSVRIEHEGINHYFPLGTGDSTLAASQALRIHRTIVEQGWERASRQFSRELTLGFRWLDNPLAWTYTTICTHSAAAPQSPRVLAKPSDKKAVIIVERDAGIRKSLAWCLDQMAEFYCAATFPSLARAVAELPMRSSELILVSQHLADAASLASLNEVSQRKSPPAILRYSIYPDSETLFAATPGGAVCYLLRRRAPVEFLEPIHKVAAGDLSNQELAARAWQYFKGLFVSRPTSVAGEALGNLTQREHEVLALLSSGHPDKEIADRLGISIYTVHGHVRNIFEKLGVHNRTGAVVKYLQK